MAGIGSGIGSGSESKVITYKISKDGQNVDIDGQGFHGSECMETAVVKRTMEAIGVTEDSKKKPSYFEEAHVHTRS